MAESINLREGEIRPHLYMLWFISSASSESHLGLQD